LFLLDTRLWNDNRKGDYIQKPITGTFKHNVPSVYELHFDSLAAPTGVTAPHPFWSADRQAWIHAADLQIGERVKTQHGITTLTDAILVEKEQTVYNLEVYQVHNYSVSEVGVLVHNVYGIGNRKPRDLVGGIDGIIYPNQSGIGRTKVESMAQQMLDNPISFWVQTEGKVVFYESLDGKMLIWDGHHRFMASQLSGVEIPNHLIKIKKINSTSDVLIRYIWDDVRWD
jgi:hypothetical protein